MEEALGNFSWNSLRFRAVFGPRISGGLWAVPDLFDSFDFSSISLV